MSLDKFKEKYEGMDIDGLRRSYRRVVHELEKLELESDNDLVIWDESAEIWREDGESSKVEMLEEEADFLFASILKYGA